MATITTVVANQRALSGPKCCLETLSNETRCRTQCRIRSLPSRQTFLGDTLSKANFRSLRTGRGFAAGHFGLHVRNSAAGVPAAAPLPDSEKKGGPPWHDVVDRLTGSQAPASLSDIVWPSLGGFIAMAVMGHVDAYLAPKGLSFTLGSFGAVCTLLFAAPRLPSAQKYNVYVSHLGCAAISVLALLIFGPGWFAKAVSLAAAMAFMQYTGSVHPPAAGLPLIMLDAPKLQKLQWWYLIYPGVIGCGFLFLLQEAVLTLRDKWKF